MLEKIQLLPFRSLNADVKQLKNQIETDVKKKNIKAIASAATWAVGTTGVVVGTAMLIKRNKFSQVAQFVRSNFAKFKTKASEFIQSKPMLSKVFNKVLVPTLNTFKTLPPITKKLLDVFSAILTIDAIVKICKNNQIKKDLHDRLDAIKERR